MRKVQAFAPAHITCIFSPYRGQGFSDTGSLGVGFTLDSGLEVELSNSRLSNEVVFNDQECSLPVIDSVLKSLKINSVLVEIKSELPLGAGFGLSGAAALATAIAVNELYSLGLSMEEIGRLAHEGEVQNQTGLGDVSGQLRGGVVLKDTVGQPLTSRRLEILPQKLYVQTLGELPTEGVLSDRSRAELISSEGERYLKEIPCVEDDFVGIVQVANDFANASGLAEHAGVAEVLNSITAAGGAASMGMLGRMVFSTAPFDDSKEVQIGLEPAGLK